MSNDTLAIALFAVILPATVALVALYALVPICGKMFDRRLWNPAFYSLTLPLMAYAIVGAAILGTMIGGQQ